MAWAVKTTAVKEKNRLKRTAYTARKPKEKTNELKRGVGLGSSDTRNDTYNNNHSAEKIRFSIGLPFPEYY